MLGPVLAVLGALTHLILINSTRERGGGRGRLPLLSFYRHSHTPGMGCQAL